MPDVHSEIRDLRERVQRLERASRRTTRGSTNQKGAAEYLNRSREWLRQRHARGEGPLRGADGNYTYDDLDAYRESGVA
jgi:hypothetical protein